MSEHLTTEQIIEFVSINELTEENIAKMKVVNAHIYRCEECAVRVQAFQRVGREFERIGKLVADGCDLNELYVKQDEELKKREHQAEFWTE